MSNIESDSRIDDWSSVGGKGLKHQLEMDTMCADERDDQVATDSFELETAVSRFGMLNGDITSTSTTTSTASKGNKQGSQKKKRRKTKKERNRKRGEEKG